MKRKSEHIIIVGAGLCGGLLALRLAQRGYQVSLYEMRGDMRLGEVDAGRSINLALSDRGLRALRLVGLEERMIEECIPMHGRMIHSVEGELRLSKYSGRQEDFINSVSRSDLNRILIEEADKHQDVSLYFDAKCTGIDIENNEVTFDQNGKTITAKGDVIIGTDGAGSRVRREMLSHVSDENKEDEAVFLSHGYKELSIPATETGGWRIDKNALHIWPRGEFMLIALPNLDGSFTVTLFLSYNDEVGFNHINSDEEIMSFFTTYFPDTLTHMPEIVKDYNDNPVGRLGTLKCFPWQHNGKLMIMGDAAHAIVPFYGQGMNASFEDVFVFDECLDKFDDDWQQVLPYYQKLRKPDTDAIADLALDNFYEMRDHVDDKVFVKKRQIEMQLEQTFPDYYSKYSLVTFNEHISYEQAMKQGRKQDEILLELCRSGKAAEMSLEEIRQYISHYV